MREKLPSKLTSVCICGAVVFAVLSVQEAVPYFMAEIDQRELKDAYVAETELPLEPDEAERLLGIRVDFAALKDINPDIVGWIYIPGTQVNYPVLCHPEDNAYYLSHSYNKKESKPGAIYIYHESSDDFTDAHTIIFGHNMASGQMFGELSNYSEKKYRDEHPYVYLCLPEQMLQCVVYSAYSCSVYDSTYRLDYTLGTEAFSELIRHTGELSLWESDYIPEKDEPVYTLSTCVDSGDASRRFVLNCAAIKKQTFNRQER